MPIKKSSAAKPRNHRRGEALTNKTPLDHTCTRSLLFREEAAAAAAAAFKLKEDRDGDERRHDETRERARGRGRGGESAAAHRQSGRRLWTRSARPGSAPSCSRRRRPGRGSDDPGWPWPAAADLRAVRGGGNKASFHLL